MYEYDEISFLRVYYNNMLGSRVNLEIGKLSVGTDLNINLLKDRAFFG